MGFYEDIFKAVAQNSPQWIQRLEKWGASRICTLSPE